MRRVGSMALDVLRCCSRTLVLYGKQTIAGQNFTFLQGMEAFNEAGPRLCSHP